MDEHGNQFFDEMIEKVEEKKQVSNLVEDAADAQERANQYFDDITDGAPVDSDSILSMDELLALKEVPHQESSGMIDASEYMVRQANPDPATMLVQLAPFATQDNAPNATVQPSIDPDLENTTNALEVAPFIDADEYQSEDTEEDNSNDDFEMGFTFDAADTIPYEDDGVYIPLEVVTAYKSSIPPSSRIVDKTPIGSDSEVGSLNNDMSRIVAASGIDVEQAGADMAEELEAALTRKSKSNDQGGRRTSKKSKGKKVASTIRLDQLLPPDETNASSDASLDTSSDTSSDTSTASDKATPTEIALFDQATSSDASETDGPPLSPSATVALMHEKPKTTYTGGKKPGAIEGSKAPNHYGPRASFDPKLEQKPFEYKFDKPKKKKKSFLRELLSYALIIFLAWGVARLLTTYVIINAKIPSGSMEDTISTGDRLFGFRLAYYNSKPQRGDIIIFPAPDEPDREYIKRIIGMPGETLQIKDGVVYITGAGGITFALEEPYLKNEPWTINNNMEPIEIPEGCYFVMGDNRNNSKDARVWENKFVKRENILAKALLRYWPLDSFGFVE